MIKGIFFSIIGFISGAIIKATWFFFDVIIKGFISVLVFFGLYLPFFHLIFAFMLWLTTGFNPFDLSIDSQLYLLGLGLHCIGALFISLRNLIFTPIKNVFKFVNKVKYKSQGKSFVPEKPDIYRSSTNPELIVYEYGNRYELFTELNGRLCYKRTDYKRGKR